MKLRDEYAGRALSQIPRLLSLLDRNEFSPTYGSFQRTFWLDKSDDFVNALPQYGVISLALVYSYKMPGNIYYGEEKIKRWAIASMNYWVKIQHKDGSFDEFYPNEHGWAGPTGFLLYAMVESFKLIGDGMNPKERDQLFRACHKAAIFLGKYDEKGILANHHAMAILPIYATYTLLKDGDLLKLAKDKLKFFYTLVSDEGWSLEYDGPDMGYLSATVSFLAKLHKLGYRDEKLVKVIKKSIEFSSYFVYPNGYYAGSMGSRQTLHFYSHGYELFAREMPLAAVIAQKMLLSLGEGKLVPPEIQADRYFLYRIPEYLLSYIDYASNSKVTLLPYEGKDFSKYFYDSKVFVQKKGKCYILINLAKGGVIKIFNGNKLIYNDNGIILSIGGKTATTQWINKKYKFNLCENLIQVKGKLTILPSKVFTPYKGLIFRSVMLTLGSNTKMSYLLKGIIRNLIIFGNKEVDIHFLRTINFIGEDKIKVMDIITNQTRKGIKKVKIGDEFFVRYVPQSLYFQKEELNIKGYYLDASELKKLSRFGRITLERIIYTSSGAVIFN